MRKTIFLLTLSLFFVSNSQAEKVAKLYSEEGDVRAQAVGQGWQEVSVGHNFEQGDALKTGVKSRAGVRFSDGFLLRLKDKSRIVFNKSEKKEERINVSAGAVYFFSRKPQRFPVIHTPHVSAAVRGTEFVVEVQGGESKISVLDGSVRAENKYGAVLVGKGEEALVKPGKAPIKRILLSPHDAVQWALYYPKILDKLKHSEAKQAIIALIQGEKQRAEVLAEKAVSKNPDSFPAALAMSYFKQSEFKLEQALDWLKKAKSFEPDNAFIHARIAELELGFAEADKSRESLARALALEPNNSYALTVKGFTELTRYQIEEARRAFERAIAKEPSLALAYLGLGLATIREGDLAGGRALLEEAVHLDPIVSLYRSYLAKAYFEEEKENLSAKEYARAIELDPLDPTPYLYRSYLNLSKHQPIQALADIQKSIELNDNRAVFRSSLLLDQDQGVRSVGLGSVYAKLGFDELARVEALKALNRDYANYSAHFLLSAANGGGADFNSQASNSERFIGRLLVPVTYNSIQPASAGQASLNEYTTLFDRPITRYRHAMETRTDVELYASATSVQSVENDFGYYADYGFEYQQGFDDSRLKRLHSLDSGGQYQASEKTTLIWDAGVAYSREDLRQKTPTAGFVFDTDENQDISSVNIQLGAHHQFSPGSHFFGVVNLASLNQSTESVALPGRTQEFSIAFDREIDPFDVDVFTFSDEDYTRDAYFLETDFQYMLQSELVTSVIGARAHFRFEEAHERAKFNSLVDIEGLTPEEFLLPFFDASLSSDADNDSGSQAVYAYTTWRLTDWVDLNAGLAYNRIEFNSSNLSPPFANDEQSKSQWNPKVGATVYLNESTTLRSAYFKALGRATRGDVNLLEPTFVGGFNQVFDQFLASSAEFYGVGVDRKFSNRFFAGADYQKRLVGQDSVAQISSVKHLLDEDVFKEEIVFTQHGSNFDEERIRAFWYGVLSDRIASTLEYARFFVNFGHLEQDTTTDRVTLKNSYFDPSGFFTTVAADWHEQRQAFDGTDFSNVESFWRFNLGLGYEFDHRRGAVELVFENLLDEDFTYTSQRGEEGFVDGINVKFFMSYNF